ncbi:MAG: hypothetical protein JRI50_10890 [Deltaproteobacteria bacterium]|nr:hypothetical protein [Deltaproteobacteria bacterium]
MIWLMGRQKRGISMLCLQRMLETPTDKPRFAAMRMVPRVSSEEIQPLVRERLAVEAVIKTDGWPGYNFLDASPGFHHEWLVPGSGKEAPKVPGRILLPFQPPLLGTANV